MTGDNVEFPAAKVQGNMRIITFLVILQSYCDFLYYLCESGLSQ